MDNRKNPINSVLDDFFALETADQDVVIATIAQIRRREGTTPAPASKKRTRTRSAVTEPLPATDTAHTV